MFHQWPIGSSFGGHSDFSWVWPSMVIFFTFGGWRRVAGALHHEHRRYRQLPPPESGDPALETLRQRFARGEIDRAEYEERRAALRERPATTGSATRPGNAGTQETKSKPDWPDLT